MNNGYYIALGAFFVVNVILLMFITKKPGGSDEEFGPVKMKSIKDFRRTQASGSGFRELAVKKKFEDTLTKKTDIKKLRAGERMLLQAGLKWSYGELKLIQLATGIILAMVTGLGMANILMGIAFFGVGILLPKQVVQFMANMRMAKLEKQVGSFIQLVTERYKSHGDFQKAVRQTAPDFKGREPMYTEIQQTVLEFEVGVSTLDAMHDLASRTGNKFLKRFSDYYSISSKLGTEDARERIVGQAYEQFNEDFQMKSTLKQQIAGPKNDAYIMLAFVPMVIAYQAFTSADYIPFMTGTVTGKIGCVGIALVLLGSVWFINKKIGAPLD